MSTLARMSMMCARRIARLPHRSPFSTATAKKTDLSAYGNVLGGEDICPHALKTFSVWHESVSSAMDAKASSESKSSMAQNLGAHVHDQIKFHPPTYFKHWEGRDEFLVLITSVSEVFGPSFTYGRQWLSPDGRNWCLEFSADIGTSGKRLMGVDMVRLDEFGRMEEFVVLARPPNAVAELKKEMMLRVPGRLAALKAKQAWSSIFG